MILIVGGSAQMDPERTPGVVEACLQGWGVTPDKVFGVWLGSEAALPASWKHHHPPCSRILRWARSRNIATALFEPNWTHYMRDAPSYRDRFMVHAALGAVASTQTPPKRVGVVILHGPSGPRQHALLVEARAQTTWGDRLQVEEVQ